MEDDKDICLKGYGFLSRETLSTKKSFRRLGRQKSERYYLNDVPGVYLTTREAEVSWHIARGCTIREAAERMSLSHRTIEFYLRNIRRKVGARNKNELLRILFDNAFFQHL